MRYLRRAEYDEQPWVNGGGVTLEIARAPSADDPACPFDWRLSLATVSRTGPFSLFPGIDRTLTVIDGMGLAVVVGEAEAQAVTSRQPFAFPGDVPADAALIDGPVNDFNVMTRRGIFSHDVAVSNQSTELAGPGAVFALEQMRVAGIDLCRHDTLLVDPAETVITDGAACLLVRFRVER